MESWRYRISIKTKRINSLPKKILKKVFFSIILIIVLTVLFLSGYILYLRMDGKKHLEKGDLVVVNEEAVYTHTYYTKYDVLLSNARGLFIETFTRIPSPITRKIPAIVLIGGSDTGRKALDLVDGSRHRVMLISMNYPYSEPKRGAGLVKILKTGAAINRAAFQTDTALRLILDYIKEKKFIDQDRIFMVCASIAVPFGTRAVAQNKEFRALALLYGYGDLYTLYKRLFYSRFKNPILVKCLARFATMAIPDFEPLDHIKNVWPRPVLFINGKRDERIPRECIVSIHQAAKEPKTIIWTEGRHMHPSDTILIKELTQLVIKWMKDKAYLKAQEVE
jgi:hypothetical protein